MAVFPLGPAILAGCVLPKSMSVLASVPSSCAELTRTERINWIDLSVLGPFQQLPGHE